MRTTDKDRTTAVEIAHKTLNSIIASQATTVEIAQQRRNAEILVTILKPNIRHEVSQGILEALETHLHGFIERLSMPFVSKLLRTFGNLMVVLTILDS